MNFVWTPIMIVKIFMKFIEGFVPEKVLELSRAVPDNEPVSALTSPDGKYLFWGKDNGPLVQNSTKLAHALSLDNTKSISIRNKFDNSVGGGLFQSQIISGTGAPTAVDSADVVIVDDISVLESYDILATAKPGALFSWSTPSLSSLKRISSPDCLVILEVRCLETTTN